MYQPLYPLAVYFFLLGVQLSFAGPDVNAKALAAFQNDASVLKAIELLEDTGYARAGAPVVRKYASRCDVIGCERSLLVIQALAAHGENPQQESVVRLVTIPADGNMSVAPFHGG